MTAILKSEGTKDSLPLIAGGDTHIMEGNEYLKVKYPNLDYIKSASIVE